MPVMTYGSLFAGAGGADIGFDRTDLECRWQVEIDPQASAVLRRHWPNVPKFGDIRTVRKKDLSPVDIVVGGFPCQDLSVAGSRKGFTHGKRSSLFYELVRVVRLLRPRYLVWENVPGLLSSDGGRDFTRVLRKLADIGYFGAWRCLVAQFFGVPQRRRRVFGVFARGRAGAVRCAQILALTEGVSGHPQTSRYAGQDVAFCLTAIAGRSRQGNRVGNAHNTTYVPVGGVDSSPSVEPLTAGMGKGPRGTEAVESGHLILDMRNQTTSTVESVPLSTVQSSTSGHAVCVTGTVTHSLTAIGADASEDGTGRGTPIVFQQNQRDEVRLMGKTVGAIASRPGMKQQNYLAGGIAQSVRRLTPRECERLMSWPDDHTRYADDGTEFADGPRYRMIGNGIVSNCAEWIARRIVAAET